MRRSGVLEYGGPLVLQRLPTPTIAHDEILVEIKSTAVNHLILLKLRERRERSSDRPAVDTWS